MKPVQELIQKIRKEEFYVPRDYKTIGGGWTVDTWKRGDIMVQVMDEGYTTVIRAPGLRIVTGYNGEEYTRFEEGTEADSVELLKELK